MLASVVRYIQQYKGSKQQTFKHYFIAVNTHLKAKYSQQWSLNQGKEVYSSDGLLNDLTGVATERTGNDKRHGMGKDDFKWATTGDKTWIDACNPKTADQSRKHCNEDKSKRKKRAIKGSSKQNQESIKCRHC
uniref:Uncharacterized protein n=1 Tax=Glossina austeni TaxID=7395 RepID=A0A1A9VXD6_GLOAU